MSKKHVATRRRNQVTSHFMLEVLEDRWMLSGQTPAVGYFVREDGVPGADVVASAISEAWAYDSNVSPYSVSDGQSDTHGDEQMASTSTSAEVSQGGAFGSSISQSLAEVLSPIGAIGATAPVPMINLSSQQLTMATAHNSQSTAGSNTYAGVTGVFQYVDTNPDQNEHFYGGIYLVGVGGGSGISNESGGGWSAYVQMNIQIWRNTELLAGLVATGWGGVYSNDTVWTVTGTVGQDSVSVSSTQLNLYIGFNTAAPINTGDTFTFLASIGNTNLTDGASSSAYSDGTGEEIFGQSILAYGQGYAEGEEPPGPVGAVSGPYAPADFNADGNIDSADSRLWAAAIGNQIAGEQPYYMVTTADDASNGDYTFFDLSVREALELAASHPGKDTIVFAPWINEIAVNNGQLEVDSNVEILGPGADSLTIDADGNSRIFYIDGSAWNARIQDVTIAGGYADYGAGIYNAGGLTLDHVEISFNHAFDSGGGVYSTTGGSSSGMTVTNSTIDNNQADILGGGVYIDSFGSLWAAIINSTISTNEAWYGGGGGIYDASSGALILNSTITGNGTYSAGGGVYSAIGTFVLNSIVAGNWAGYGTDVYGTFYGASAYNLIGYDPSQYFPNGSGNNLVGVTSPIDARLAPLAYYGGRTKTQPLLSDSPAIDAGATIMLINMGWSGTREAIRSTESSIGTVTWMPESTSVPWS